MRRLDLLVRQRIFEAFDRYVAHRQGDLKKLRGKDNEWRLSSTLSIWHNPPMFALSRSPCVETWLGRLETGIWPSKIAKVKKTKSRLSW